MIILSNFASIHLKYYRKTCQTCIIPPSRYNRCQELSIAANWCIFHHLLFTYIRFTFSRCYDFQIHDKCVNSFIHKCLSMTFFYMILFFIWYKIYEYINVTFIIFFWACTLLASKLLFIREILVQFYMHGIL